MPITAVDQLVNTATTDSEKNIDLKNHLTQFIAHLTGYEKKLELKLSSLKQMLQDLTQSNCLVLTNAQSSAATTLDEEEQKREDAIQIARQDIQQGLKEIQDGIKEIKRLISEMVNNQL
ncbi:hypothetical protein [Parashewanella tropica]|uniref:hypothetical protein n=1 Tax=Parashewanella tropica TaxID=2547970 RepID=UPI00105A5608|nr:hypothetical protein [Parashewanella tropica]